uniref:VWFA domain-containing protein n=1 Tax=Astatotilapia calliptera TaxID=8154 RepID=A0AAX7UD82_ASTCA
VTDRPRLGRVQRRSHLLLTCVFSFNVDQKNSLSFSGPLEDMFGYTVQQFENSEGKWVLIGSPLSGQPSKRTGDVYKCPVGRDNNNCIKLELPKNTTIPNLREVKENMTMGSTLVTNPKGGFLACGPQYGYKCGPQHFISGVCTNVSSSFQILNSFTKYQECGKEMDLVIVLDGSNSIYPWSSITEFLNKFIGRLEIGPKQTQVGIVSYGETVSHQVNLSQFDNMPALRDFVQVLPQHTGTKTMTFLGIDTAREEAFMPERGARPGVKKVMVIVTDGESHDYYNLQKVIKACEHDDIERFGIAVLGDYGRQNKSLSEVQKFIKEIQNISSEPIQDHFFNVSDEAALVNIVDTLGSRILALEATSGNSTSPIQMEMSQTGFSAHTSNEGVLLGAVGAYEWNGTVVMYTPGGDVVPGKDAFFDPLKEARNERLAAYLGYDVQSASTSEGELYITGAPRYNHTGRVVIYRLDENNRIVISQILKGEQIGSYFGSVLQTVDVDNDSLTDLLLVGAPMYMGPEKDEQGRVYVYRLKHEYTLKPINQSCCTLQSAGCTNKNEPCGARFGTAIAAVTDLNLDGYNDVAIGAPFENDHRGAVYIYHGDQKSLKKKFVQHIPAGGDGEKVKFFGQSIHGVMDLNGDGITDITIGGLGGASLFWSRDVAELHASMTFNPSKVNLQQIEHQCEHGNRKSICAKTNLCFTYRVKSNQPTVKTTANMTYTITLDSLRATSRASFISKDLKNDRRTTQKFTIMDGTKECMEKTFMMSASCVFLPVQSLTLFSVSDEEGPVLDESLPKSINANVRPLISLMVSFSKIIDYKLIKEKEIIYLNITVKNLKDKAYNTNVKINFTQNINFVNVETTTVNDTEVSIEVGYPFLGNNEEVSFICLETITVKFEVNLKYFQKEIEQVKVSNIIDDDNNNISISFYIGIKRC